MYKMPSKRNKASTRGKKHMIRHNLSHHNNHININLSGISRKRKGTGKSRGSRGKHIHRRLHNHLLRGLHLLLHLMVRLN